MLMLAFHALLNGILGGKAKCHVCEKISYYVHVFLYIAKADHSKGETSCIINTKTSGISTVHLIRNTGNLHQFSLEKLATSHLGELKGWERKNLGGGGHKIGKISMLNKQVKCSLHAQSIL